MWRVTEGGDAESAFTRDAPCEKPRQDYLGATVLRDVEVCETTK
jgi:hypothetical protein